MSEEELRKLVESNARAIEALTANVNSLTRDRQEMYRLADVASSQSELASAMADFFDRSAQTDQRQGEHEGLLLRLKKAINISFIAFSSSLLLISDAYSQLPQTTSHNNHNGTTNLSTDIDSSSKSITTKSSQLSKHIGLVGQIDNIARQITVRIRSVDNGSGSGVIIGNKEDTYYVLTASHIVKNRDSYTLVTPDGKHYKLQNSTFRNFDGIDLALIQFTSEENYSTATLANYDINDDDSPFIWCFVSGFPAKQEERNLTPGILIPQNIAEIVAKDFYSFANGNELLYTNLSSPGMSGGAVLDRQGNLIGINIGAENEYIEDKKNEYKEVALGYSLGISIETFLDLAKSANIPLEVLKKENSIPPKLNEREIALIKNLFSLKAPGDNATATDWLNYGNQLWRASEEEEAVQAFDRAIALNPKEYRAYYAKGLALSYFGNIQHKIDAFRQVTKLAPNFSAAWHQLALALEYEGYGFRKEIIKRNQLEALAAYNHAIELEPKRTIFYNLKGRLLKDLKRYEEAISSYNRSLELQPNSLAYAGRADIYFQLKNYQSAIADYNRSLELQPNSLAYASRDDTIFLLEDSYSDVISDYRQDNKRSLKITYIYVYSNLGLAYSELKDYKSAIAIFSQFIEKTSPPQTDAQRHDRSSFYINRGNAYSELKDYKSARADYDKAILLYPENSDGYVNRGLLYHDLKDYRKAKQDWQKGAEIMQQQGKLQAFIKDIQQIARRARQQGNLEDYQQLQQLLEVLMQYQSSSSLPF